MYPVIIALDFPSKEDTLRFLNTFQSEKLFVKIGMELFYQEGPQIVSEIKEMGHQIFLDLKLHDIPNTVYHAMKGLACLGVDLVTIHAAGGSEMMKAAINGLEDGKITETRAKCIAVTQLTSTTESMMQEEQNIAGTLEDSVLNYAYLAKKVGLDGVVSSVHEANQIRELGENFLIITPGIRMKEDEVGDQKRVADPRTARQKGSSGIVVGRSITSKEDPYQAYVTIKHQWEMNEK